MSFKIKLLLIFSLIYLFSCREKFEAIEDSGVDPDYPELISGHELSLSLSNLKVYLNESGEVYQPYHSYSLNGWTGQIFNSGMWIAGYQNGEVKANAAGVTQYSISSNYFISTNNTSGSVYYFTPGMLETLLNIWPQEAPKNELNQYRVYGSEMCWVNLGSLLQNGLGMYAAPFDSLCFSQSVYFVDERYYEHVIFIRYSIRNESSNDITELYLGYYNDSDIRYEAPNNDYAAYDSIWQISYIYTKEPDPQYSRYFGCGTIILQTPNGTGTDVQLNSNRYISRDDSTNYGEFILTPQSVFYALKGLDNNGMPMRNFITGEETKFALSGNPVTGTGWNDTQRDARTLISVGPYNLPRGSEIDFTIALYIESGNSLESLITSIKLTGSRIIINRQIWE